MSMCLHACVLCLCPCLYVPCVCPCLHVLRLRMHNIYIISYAQFYVCLCITHMCTYLCVRVYVCVRTYECMCMCTDMYGGVVAQDVRAVPQQRQLPHGCANVRRPLLHSHMCVCVCCPFGSTSTFTHTHPCTYLYMYVHARIYACIYMRIYIYIRIHLHIYIWAHPLYICFIYDILVRASIVIFINVK